MSNLLQPDSDEPSSGAAKSDMLVSIARMRGLFKPLPENTLLDEAPSDVPPSYEAVTQRIPDTPRADAKVPLTSSGYPDEKLALRQADTHGHAATFPLGSKETALGNTSR
jgi:hypothetical protein